MNYEHDDLGKTKAATPSSVIITPLLQKTLVSFIFGFIVALVFSLGAALNLEPIRKLERGSLDYAARIAASYYDLSKEYVKLPADVNPIVMIDIDIDTCSELSNQGRCQFDRIGQEEVFQVIFKTIASESPLVSIVDIFIPPDTNTSLLSSNDPASIVLTPMDLRAAENGSGTTGFFALNNSVCGETVCGPLQYLPAQVISQDGIARKYPLSTTLSAARIVHEKADNRVTKAFDTVAYKAATLASPKSLPVSETQQTSISYSFPSFAIANPDFQAKMNLRFRGNVHYYFGNNLLSDDKSRFEVDIPENSILIFGSSAASGGDIHNTPLGPMCGMEVMANAIRSFQSSRPNPLLPSTADMFLAKTKAVMLAVIIIMIGQFVILTVEHKRSVATGKGKKTILKGAFWDRYSSLLLFIMLAIFVFEFLGTLSNILQQMEDPAGRASQIDVIWPVIGVLFSAFLGFAGKVTGKIEWLVNALFKVIAPKYYTSH